MHLLPILFVFVPIFTAIFIYLFKSDRLSWIVFVGQALLIGLFVYYVIEMPADKTHLLVIGGTNQLIRISFYNDITSLSFIALTLFMWLVILLYTYNTNRKENKFLFFLMFLEGIFLGLIQTNDLFNMFVFLELIAILVTILIAYKKTGSSFRAGIYYLLLNTVAAMMFLVGIILIYYTYGTINIQIVMQLMGENSESMTIKLAYILMLSGISVKAALFPLFTWLPKAHGVAQSTISALLSGLVVKGALYMLIRINHQMFALAEYQTSDMLFWIGTTTALVGVMFALSQKDLKQILAYHTVSQVGIMVMGLSAMEGLSYIGGLMHIFNHALFKSLLFLGAGIIIKAYQTKKVYEIRGVFRTMPWTAILLIVGMLSITGAPFFNGFVSKSLIKYEFKYDMIKMVLFTLINIGTVTSFIKFSTILFGPKQKIKYPRNYKQHIGMSLMALMCLLIGILYLWLGKSIYQIDLSYVHLFDVWSFLDYAIYLGIGYLFYRYVIHPDYKPTQKLREFSLTFENANFLFIAYIVTIGLVVILQK
ncbi:MAG: proton-conducting transporter membrane subunit [Acholeplasmataceae bacterium]|jgi:multicomponent Na+:H+ antiporter subunit D|nr:proton-conducting transporter membrane subunit [Acholeplasmataceae bacterium]